MIFSKRLVRIKFIQHIQTDLEEYGAGKLYEKIHFLNQAYVFQLIAYWQSFIEELAVYGFRLIEKNEPDSPFRNIAKAKLDESLKRFNTPKKENIDKLFKETLGIQKISQNWNSESLTQKKAEETLEELLESRHQIAHTGDTTNFLSYDTNFEKMKILFEIAKLTEQILIKQLTVRTDSPEPPID
jgi:hypothetical protein